MNKTTEALKLAEEALEKVKKLFRSMTADECPDDPYISVGEALAAIREALAEPVKQEPVAYFLDVKAECSSKPSYEQVPDEYKNDADVFPFYAAPVDAKAIRFEALEEAAKVCRTAQAQGLQSIREAIEEAIRGLK